MDGSILRQLVLYVFGAVSERLKEMVSKTIELVRVPGVRIPPAPSEARSKRGFETKYRAPKRRQP